ncbi:hypothetical protein [Peptoniphilus timonensis]|uniref:hypothetical protein n=1 Tax=Peptoniphilus timonensis TaxID=1268254 RepID=UPI0002F6D0C0|nr:hypothetical protein [Peptoniphilus timonensis]
MKKIIILMCILLLAPSTIFAKSTENKGSTKVQLDLLNVELPYPREEINIVYENDLRHVTAKIYDKSTNELLEEYTETKEVKEIGFYRANSDYVYRTLVGVKRYGPTSVRVVARVKVYVWGTTGTFVQISEVQDKYSLPGDSGRYSLEGDRVYLNSSLPSRSIELNAVGNIVIESVKSSGFDVELLESVGFSVTKSENWFARKFYNFNITLGV